MKKPAAEAGHIKPQYAIGNRDLFVPSKPDPRPMRAFKRGLVFGVLLGFAAGAAFADGTPVPDEVFREMVCGPDLTPVLLGPQFGPKAPPLPVIETQTKVEAIPTGKPRDGYSVWRPDEPDAPAPVWLRESGPYLVGALAMLGVVGWRRRWQ